MTFHVSGKTLVGMCMDLFQNDTRNILNEFWQVDTDTISPRCCFSNSVMEIVSLPGVMTVYVRV